MTKAQAWAWRLDRIRPPIAATLSVAEAIRGALSYLSQELGAGALPEAFHGERGSDHSHAFWLPADEDVDGLIDHIWVFAEVGLPATVVALLARIDHFRLHGEAISLSPLWLSPRIAGGLFGPALVWTAMTPYVTPRWRLTKTGKERAEFSIEAQLRDEIARRPLPAPTEVTWSPSRWTEQGVLLASAFSFERRAKGGPPADAVASFPTVAFPEPVVGPLAFGFGAHFGLGQLMPMYDAD